MNFAEPASRMDILRSRELAAVRRMTSATDGAGRSFFCGEPSRSSVPSRKAGVSDVEGRRSGIDAEEGSRDVGGDLVVGERLRLPGVSSIDWAAGVVVLSDR